MKTITIESCVEDALRRGLTGEALFQSVMARINRPGVEAEWGRAPVKNPFWFEGIDRDAHGRKLSKKQTQAAINRHLIQAWEEAILNRWESEPETSIDPFIDVPFGTLTALDEANGWDVTLAARIRRSAIDQLLRDLRPMLVSIARKVRRAFSLEEACQDDLIQEAQIKIASRIASYEGRAEFSTWVFCVGRRAMVDEARRLQTQRAHERVGLEFAEIEAVDELAPVEDRLATRPILAKAFGAVHDSTLVVQQLLGFADREISEENLRMKRSRARRKLATTLRADPEFAVARSS